MPGEPASATWRSSLEKTGATGGDVEAALARALAFRTWEGEPLLERASAAWSSRKGFGPAMEALAEGQLAGPPPGPSRPAWERLWRAGAAVDRIWALLAPSALAIADEGDVTAIREVSDPDVVALLDAEAPPSHPRAWLAAFAKARRHFRVVHDPLRDRFARRFVEPVVREPIAPPRLDAVKGAARFLGDELDEACWRDPLERMRDALTARE